MTADARTCEAEEASRRVDWYRPSPFEIAAGWVHGREPAAVAEGRIAEHPASVLRAALREELLRGPCVVPFSGGRDSSLVLAVACDVAREAGVELPTAVTLTYPGDPAAEESSWQELVVRRLADRGLRPAWDRLAVHDQVDVVGPLVVPHLAERRHPLWPPSIGASIAVARHAAGATLLTGDHGDEVLGLRRATLLSGVVRRRGRGLTAADLRAVAGAAAPRTGVAVATVLAGAAPQWLNGHGRRAWRRRAAADALAEPLRWDRGVRRSLSTRAVVLGRPTLRAVAEAADARSVAPLGSPRLLASLATHAGGRGLVNRAAGVRLLAGGLLPDELVTRRSKAVFNASRFSEHTRRVLGGPRRLGTAAEWVDETELGRVWSDGVPPAGTAALVQQVWLGQQGLLP